MFVPEIIADLRATANTLTTVARILARLKTLITETGTQVNWDKDDRVTFHCSTKEAVDLFSQALRTKIEMRYCGASSHLEADYMVGSILFRFRVETIRKVRLDDCRLERKRKSSTGWRTAILTFQGRELANLKYHDRTTPEDLKKALWEFALRNQETGRFQNYEFVL